MADESEKRFLAVMDKLFHAPPKFKPTLDSGDQLSSGKKRMNPWPDLTVGEQNLRVNTVNNLQKQSRSSKSVQPPQCRPWDRGDLFRRLATFKSMTWFAKPQAMSAINCARRGWINVDVDTIACEACGARLLVSTPQAWTQEQIEKTALVYSLKLDSGHKLLCPWVDNICDEGLAQFPPKQSFVLVGDYKKRYNALSQLLALPAISSSAIDYMRSPQLDHFLKEHNISGHTASTQTSTSDHLGYESDMVSSVSYNQAQRIISLCGWEPHQLTYTVGCKEAKDQSVSNASSDKICDTVSVGPNHSVNEFASTIVEGMEEVTYNTASEIDFDPNSVVLDCQLCGARVGLWAFSSLPRPMDFLRLVGYTDISGRSDTSNYNNSTQKVTDIAPIGTKVLDEGPSKLNLTIAGGPPPTKQNYRAIISLPLVGRNLRARFSSDLNFSDQSHVSNSSKVPKDQNIVVVSENEARGETSESREHNVILENQSTSSNAVVQDSLKTSELGENRYVNSLASGDQEQCSSQEPSDSYSMIGGTAACVDGNKSKNGTHAGAVNSTQCDSRENRNVGHEVLPVDNLVPSALEEGLPVVPLNKKMDFDPIRQHRHFCPWITSTNNSKPGWQQTLSALQRHNEFSSPSAESTSSSLIEVDDPIESIRKLFAPPSSKRTKLSNQFKAGEVSAVKWQGDYHAL